MNAVEILYQDAHLIAVHKPGGLAAQADMSGDTHVIEVLTGLFPQDPALGLPHRLDRPVSGVLLITRTQEALVAMSTLFAARAVRKTYWAIVSGTPPTSATWEHRLVHDARQHKARVTVDPSVEVSRTGVRRLVAGERYSLIELVPEGGRFHQLRAQCAAAGFPIKGDVKYGARRGEKDRSIALHARSLAFTHPFDAREIHVVAEPPGTLWTTLLKGASPIT